MDHSHESPLLQRAMGLYRKLILDGPMAGLIVVAMLALTAFFAFHMKTFKMDASSDSILLENDPDMRRYFEATEGYGSDEFVAVMVTPKEDLFADSTLAHIKKLSDELKTVSIVGSVTSILNVPLFHSPDVPLLKLADGYKTLESPDVDKALAKKELLESPLFSDFLISKDGKTTILQANFKLDSPYNQLYFKRFHLREKRKDARKNGVEFPAEDAKALEEVSKEYRRRYEEITTERRAVMAQIRKIMEGHRDWTQKIYLGGVPMIVADIVRYVQRDIYVFGALVVVFVMLMLALLFRSWKLTLIPMVTCVMALVWMIGYLGLTDWHTTIVTSNFSSLLLIMTTENAIHLATHWREYCSTHPNLSNREIAFEAARAVIRPCFFSTFTTVVGFASLIVSGIRPIMDFGLMMTYGLTVSLVICFTFMPAVLAVLPRWGDSDKPRNEEDARPDSAVSVFARVTDRYPAVVIACALLVFVVCGLGVRRLTVENRFMDYFRKSTEVNRGMVMIDTELGGTMPLDVIIKGDGPDYWMDMDHLKQLQKVHEWLDALPETGKVVSLHTLVLVLQGINQGKPVTKALLGLVRSRLPESLRAAVIGPYVNSDFSEVRVSMRMKETDKTMNRKELIAKIKNYLEKDSGIPPGKSQAVGMLLLYNNMLQTLFGSQIKTLGTVLLTVFIVFLFVFRNVGLALIGMVPNILAVTTILGMIGWLGIPLDMMTIMIAAITFGLADDNTIHYIVRFRQEFPKDRDYKATMYRCHNSVGRALSYSMITIVVGFGILGLSNFLPTVYFGVFTGVAMFLALIASHTVLPLMILYFKPLGKGA